MGDKIPRYGFFTLWNPFFHHSGGTDPNLQAGEAPSLGPAADTQSSWSRFHFDFKAMWTKNFWRRQATEFRQGWEAIKHLHMGEDGKLHIIKVTGLPEPPPPEIWERFKHQVKYDVKMYRPAGASDTLNDLDGQYIRVPTGTTFLDEKGQPFSPMRDTITYRVSKDGKEVKNYDYDLVWLPGGVKAILQQKMASRIPGLATSIKRPDFLLSDLATQTFIDSVRASMQHDVVGPLPLDPIEYAVNRANATLDRTSIRDWNLKNVDHRLDLINLAWTTDIAQLQSTLMGDPASDAALAAMTKATRKLFSSPELDSAAMLLKGVQMPDAQRQRVYQALAMLSWGENQGDANATYKGKVASSASGMWATTKAADIDGVKYVAAHVASAYIAKAKNYYDKNKHTNVKFGFDKVQAGTGIVLEHHFRILREWSFIYQKGWLPNRPSDSAVAFKYQTLLKDEFCGYMWLQTLYHIRNYADKNLPPAQDKDRVAKDYVFATVMQDEQKLIAAVWKSLGPAVSDKPETSATERNTAGGSAAGADAGVRLSLGSSAAASRKSSDWIYSKWKPLRTYFNKKMGRMISRPHLGVDIRADHVPLKAVGDGRVARIGFDADGWGHYVEIYVPEFDAHYLYAHMSKVAVKNNEVVKAGQVIGVSGSTGNAEKAHLHFEYRPNVSIGGSVSKGKPKDPETDPHLAWRFAF